MHNELNKKRIQSDRRKLRIRKALRGTADKPRLCVVKTNKHIHAQLVNDQLGVTLGHATTSAKEYRSSENGKKSRESAQNLGKKLAELAKSLHIQTVVFDRGKSSYHGVLASLADAMREGGIQF